MTKFEEEAIKEAKKSKVIAKSYEDRFTASDIGLNIKLGGATHNFPWLEFAKNWHSDEEFQDLKSQLQQQALPVVPDFIGKLINTFGTPEDGKYINYAASYPENQKELDWIDNHQKTWLTALIVGFTVEKQQLFYLKNKLTTSYLALDINTGYYEHWGEEIIPRLPDKQGYKISFTQQEIASMQTGSYELVPVEDGE